MNASRLLAIGVVIVVLAAAALTQAQVQATPMPRGGNVLIGRVVEMGTESPVGGAVVVAIAGFATSVPIGIACVIFFVVYQQVENYLVYPTVMRRSVHVSDLAAIVAALLGVALLGIIGALIAIPVTAAIQLMVREVLIPRQEAR